MKKALFITTIIGGSFLYSPVFSQEKVAPDSLGLPGDNLNLYGVLDLFQKSETLEEFEKKLNAEDSKVNNLDLNGNDKIDYISVVDNVKGSAHAIVLQVAVNEKETQDVAVIEVEKDKDDKVQIQVVGDEQLYGKNYIIEPKEDASKTTTGGTPNPGYSDGKSGISGTGDEKKSTVTNTTNNYYNSNNNANNYSYPAGSWTIVRYMYYPTYTVYVSPWRWGYYPGYWNPWAPLYWHSYYYGYHHNHYHDHYGYYHRSYSYRNNTAHDFYGQRRSTAASVDQRRVSGDYRKTYSRPDLAPKQSNDRRLGGDDRKSNSNNDGRKSNSTIDNNRQTKEGQNRSNVNENKEPSRNNNRVNKTQDNKRPSKSVKPQRSQSPKSSPAPRSTPRSGSKSGNKGSGGR
ncbi:MAG: hypothetical protein Q7W13_06890 [Bacteroidia bacterium]|nr:hypothetical protein [Bacteroidia bacterium]